MIRNELKLITKVVNDRALKKAFSKITTEKLNLKGINEHILNRATNVFENDVTAMLSMPCKIETNSLIVYLRFAVVKIKWKKKKLILRYKFTGMDQPFFKKKD